MTLIIVLPPQVVLAVGRKSPQPRFAGGLEDEPVAVRFAAGLRHNGQRVKVMGESINTGVFATA